jgi:DegV family protein with EDD domain
LIKIVTDSTADLPDDLVREHGIVVVPVLAQFGRETLRDGIDITKDQFYARLVASDEPPKTAAPSVGMFEEAFRAAAADGSEILSISLVANLSGTFNAARQAAQLLENARIVCVDSQTTTMPMGLIVLKAAQAARAGRSLGEVAALVEALRSRAVLYVALQTLRYLEKGGRIGKMRALLGTMLSVKPILQVANSEVQPVEQVRTWKRVPARMVELAQSRGAYDELAVLYTTERGVAEQVADLCAAAGLLSRERVYVVQAGGVLGTHVGPGAFGIGGILSQ